MNDQPQIAPAETTRALLKQFFGAVRLARATELAQSERYAEAEALLTGSGPPENGREMDLLARIAARQGRFDEARELWNNALRVEPQNRTYRGCLESLTPARQAGRIIATHEGKLWNLLIVVIAILVIGTLLFVFRK